MSKYSSLFVCFCVYSWFCSGYARFSPMEKFDPKLSWYTLKSEHFAVHFSARDSFESQEQLARDVIIYCEDAYAKLVPFMGWRPKQRTNIVIADIYDYVSGWATPFPNNTIFISPTFDKDMLVNYNDWLNNLIVHEYTHILNMDMAYGFSGFFRKLFGRIITPNAVMPLFFNEGLSVYNETKFTGFGRSNSTYYRMMMRSAVLDNKIFPIDKWVTYELAQFPCGETPYFYGSMFNEFLTKKYGDKILTKYANWYSGGIPLFFNAQAKRIYGKTFGSLWQDFKTEITNNYQHEIAKISQNPTSQSTQLTFEGFYTSSPLFSSDSSQIYYLSRNSNEYPSLKVLDLTTHKTKTLLRKPISSALRLSNDGAKLIFSIRDIYKNFYTYDDIYIYNILERKLIRLTKGLRARDPDFSPTENKIVFVKNELGQTNLYLMDLDSNKINQITHSDDYTQYSQPRFSPDGNKIAVAVWKPGGEQDIYVYDLITGWVTPITQDIALDIQPCWTIDNEYLLFSSDQSGVFNIYAYRLKNHKLYPITNVLTGAFEPSLSADNKKLIFLQYSSKGYDVHLMDFNIDTLTFFVIASDSQVEDPELDSGQVSYTKEQTYSDSIQAILYHYNPFPSILPKFWLPLAMYRKWDKWSFGAMTYGADALFQHQYLLQAYYNLQTKKPFVYFDYTLDKFYPTILINANYEHRRLDGSISSRFAFIKNNYRQYLTTSYQFDKYYKFYWSGLGIFYQFNNTKYYPYSISLEQGRYLGIEGKINNKLLFSYDNSAAASLVFAEYLNLPFPHHVLMLNVNIGFTQGNWFYTFGGSNASFRIRGQTERYSAHHGLSLTTEYRFPLLWIERGLGIMPIFFKNFSGKIFFDYGKPLNSSLTALMGIGAELSLNTLLFYEVPTTLTFGIASDTKHLSKPQIYFQFSPNIPFVNNRKLFKD